MGKKSLTLNFDFRLAVVLIIYTILGLCLIKYYRYQINPDGISYISIAQKYLNGDFSDAINGYWGPLISWLLMPFLYFGLEPLLAAKVLNLIIGLITIVVLRALSHRFSMSELIRTVILFSAIPLVLSFAFSDITPDLLLTCILLFYFTVLFGANYAERINKGILCGALGGIAYLAKSFSFPFFISHFFIMNVLHYLRSEPKHAKKKVLYSFLTGAATFAVISGVWIGLLCNKYGEFTLSRAGTVNYRAVTDPSIQGISPFKGGFREPPDATAVSSVDEPGFPEAQIDKLRSSMDGNVSNRTNFGIRLKNQLKRASECTKKTANILMTFSPLSLAIGIAYVLFWLQRFNIKAIQPEVLYSSITFALYAGGYSLIHVTPRYLWIICLVLLLMGGYVLFRLFQNKFFTKMRRMVLLAVFFLSFVVPASQVLRSYANRGKWIYDLSRVLKDGVTPNCKIASNTNWASSLFLSYHLGVRYYGVQEKNISEIELKRQLEKYAIDYYLVWSGAASDFSFLSNYQDITGGRIPWLKIYGLKKPR